MKKVQVLMSTYNGEKYLIEQVDSILAQKGVEVYILVRDDGSKDNTVNILREYKNVEVIQAENVGVCKSFFELIDKSGEYDYYAFADQDDVWDSDKLSVAIKTLEKNSEIPAVYASNTRLVDANLSFIRNEEDNPKTTLGSAFIKNYCTGCTMVFNHCLINYLRIKKPEYAPMHDWWVNLVCLAVGGVSYYDTSAHMNYRQHGRNVLGAEISFFSKAKNRWNKLLNNPYRRDIIAKELFTIYSDVLPKSSIEVLQLFTKSKLKIIMDKHLKTNDYITNMLFFFCVLFNKL